MLLSAIAMAAVLAAAEPAAAQAPPAAPAAKAEKPKKVCVEQQQMGSLFSKRICATPEEWEKRRVLDQEVLARTGGKVPGAPGQ